jgi:hypothetical protein
MVDPDWELHCVDFASAHLKSATGRDVWGELGVSPRSWRDAADMYRRLGVTSLRDAVTAVLGPPVDPKLAHRGDLALVESAAGVWWALGIVRGDVIECCDRMLSISRAVCAWRVG